MLVSSTLPSDLSIQKRITAGKKKVKRKCNKNRNIIKAKRKRKRMLNTDSIRTKKGKK